MRISFPRLARATELFQRFRQIPRGHKTVKTVLTNLSVIDTQLKLGVNEKLLSNSLLQVTSHWCISVGGVRSQGCTPAESRIKPEKGNNIGNA